MRIMNFGQLFTVLSIKQLDEHCEAHTLSSESAGKLPQRLISSCLSQIGEIIMGLKSMWWIF